MTTMRKWFGSILTITAVFAVGPQALATEPRAERTPVGAASVTKGIDNVTDGQGHPVNLQNSAATPALPSVEAAGGDATVVRRGRAWWPYSAALPPYTAIGKRVEAMTEDEILVNGVAMLSVRDVKASLQSAPKELLIETGSQLAERDGFYLVKIKGFTRTQEQIDALTSAGAVLGEYLNVNTYIAKIPSVDYAAVKALPFVSFVGEYQPAYKISPRLGLEEIPVGEATDEVTGQAKPWVLEIILHQGVYLNDVLSDLGRLRIFPQAEDIISNDAMTLLRVRTLPDAVPALAMIPGIKWIAEKSYPRLLASSTNPATIPMVLQNNAVYTTNTALGWKLWNAGIDGTGQVVTMMDSGLNTKIELFSQDILSNGTVGPAHRKVVGYDPYGGGDQCVLDNANPTDGGHGAKTSQHAVGSISNMTVNPDVTHVPNGHFDNGIARGAKVYFQDIGLATGGISPPADLSASITAAIGKGSFVQNHSWGAATNAYDSQATNLDTALFNNPNFVATVSAGNRGAAGTLTLGSPSTAKNAICVGGNDVSTPNSLFIDCLWDGAAACTTADLGSSRGPVSGAGRTKPDIMAFIWSTVAVGGEQMAFGAPTAMCQTDVTKAVYWNYTNLGNEGGTSFAAPEVAGLAALVRDYFVRGFYPTGSPVPGNAITPSGALVKAIILASGEAMNTTSSPQGTAINARYSSDVGYGRANLPGALHIGNGAPFLSVQNSDNLGQGSTKSFFYSINSNTMPLRVMMVYYDAAGDALQKDADLKVTIGGNVYWGNNFSSGWSTSATSTRDHTNNTEGVFLDAAHGLPASGTVQVDVIGFNNPGGMPYSLVVVGDVASQAVTQVNLDKGAYTCSDTVKVTVNDAAATSPVSVTLVSKNSLAATIDTKVVSCTGANGVFVGTIQTGSGIVVASGGSLTATYAGAAAPATASVACQIGATDSGFSIAGGCDNAAAGTDPINGPLFNGNSNEYYNKFMDAGEYTAYTFRFKNTTGVPLTNVSIALSFSGAGAAKMSVLNGPLYVGNVPVDGIAGGVFQVYTDPSTTPLTAVNMDFDITSPADGYTAAKRLTQVQLLQTNDTITRLDKCTTFNTALAPFAESTAVTRSPGPAITNTWRWSGSATTPATVGSETRVDGACGSSVPNAAAMVGNTPTTVNFNNNADSFLYLNFIPALRGNGPSGQPYHYVWKWHSFYHASEAGSNQGGVWGAFYNDKWNSTSTPTGDQLKDFPISLCCYYHTIFDYPSGGVGSWNWETANTGTPDVPSLGPTTGGAPNQLIVTFGDGVTGLATTSSQFAYGHRHADIWWYSNPQTHGTHRDVALDNDRLVYDEYYANGQPAASCGAGGQLGQVAFDLTSYNTCPNGSAVLSVVDANAVSGIQVTVTSGLGDSEVVTLTGTAPFFSGTLNLSTTSGLGAGNGVLFVLPNDTLSASYTDSSPAGSTTAAAVMGCAGGNVVYVSNTQVSDNGDNDGLADNNETVTLDITIQNNLATALTNAKVKIYADSPNVDCISDPEALYGTVAAGASSANPAGDRFTFHVKPSVACSDSLNPPTARFVVVITGDGFDGSASLQSFTISLDLDPTPSGGPYTYTQNFNTDPGWATGSTPDDTGSPTCGPYSNNFHWCAACGNAGAGYGAWVGNSAFGTSGQNYPTSDSSTLYSPAFVANGNVSLQFSVAYRTETTYDGAIVQYSLNSGTWTDLAFTTPAQAALTATEFCSPFNPSINAWTGTTTGTAWTATNTAVVPSTTGQAIQFRWRLGSDSSIVGTTYGGLGVDDVTISNLKQTVTCEPTRNTGLPNCPFSCALAPNGTPCDDANACTQTDTCQSGVCVGANPVVCTPLDQCHDAGTCSAGVCSNPNKANGSGCNDGNACTQTDTCQSGSCVGANPVVCTPLDQCHVAGTCSAGVCSNPSKADGSACDDANGCTVSDACTAGVCGGTAITAPGEAQLVIATDKNTFSWSALAGATRYDALRGALGALPVGPGGGDEFCFDNLGTAVLVDATTPAPGTGFWYVSRGENTCGNGSYGTQSNATPRTSTTCP